MSILAFIPARAGSKGLPGKCLRPLAGKPLAQYTLEAGIAAVGARNVFLSTDDEGVIQLARKLGIAVDYRRPTELAGDTAAMADAVAHGLEWLARSGPLPEFFVLLQPTSPFRTGADVVAAMEKLRASAAPGVVGVSPMWTPPADCVEMRADGSWNFLIANDFKPKRRQDMAGSYWFINGAIYGLRTQNFLRDRQFVHPDSLLFPMSDENTVDIDLPRDLLVAEALMRSLKP